MKKFILALLLFVPFAQAESVLTLSKTPFEIFDISVDFCPSADNPTLGSTCAAPANAIALTSVTAIDDNGANATVQIVAASPAPAILSSTSQVVFAARGGVPGYSYTISVKVINTSTGEQFEGHITLNVIAQ